MFRSFVVAVLVAKQLLKSWCVMVSMVVAYMAKMALIDVVDAK